MHVFPQLRELERKYSAEMVVIGVHSAKFTAEKATNSVRKAILRYEIGHPVVNDHDFDVWQRYAVRAWPTLMFIDPQGKVVGKHEGEIVLDAFDEFIGEMVARFDEQGSIDRRPLSFKLERDKEEERQLSFPGKVLADASSDRLFIADSNHNRVVIASLRGEVLDVVGTGEKGLVDGGYNSARFDDPQGMALDDDSLYVADTKNHAVRRIDLGSKEVETLAGTGEQASMFHAGGSGLSTALNSPWDLALNDGNIYIAMAGFHQLWRLDLETQEVVPHAGSGRERIEDGPLDIAALAQPSGIVTDGSKLYFTDSETSAVRTADMSRSGRVATIVGQHLFTFGDVDGVGDEVRLQHPLGIDLHDGVLYITDTYNNKVKTVFPATRDTVTLLGTGSPGHKDGPGLSAEFDEPGGLSIADGMLFIADTNNHAIRTADLASCEVATLELNGI
jgi:hypothetical protein